MLSNNYLFSNFKTFTAEMKAANSPFSDRALEVLFKHLTFLEESGGFCFILKPKDITNEWLEFKTAEEAAKFFGITIDDFFKMDILMLGGGYLVKKPS